MNRLLAGVLLLLTLSLAGCQPAMANERKSDVGTWAWVFQHVPEPPDGYIVCSLYLPDGRELLWIEKGTMCTSLVAPIQEAP